MTSHATTPTRSSRWSAAWRRRSLDVFSFLHRREPRNGDTRELERTAFVRRRAVIRDLQRTVGFEEHEPAVETHRRLIPWALERVGGLAVMVAGDRRDQPTDPVVERQL